MLGLYRQAGSMPPTVKEVTEQMHAPAKEITAMLGLLVREGLLFKVAEDLYFEAKAMEELIKKTIALAAKNNAEITLAGFKEATGLTRKFMIPLLEYFDKTKLTMRVGDKRLLRRQG